MSLTYKQITEHISKIKENISILEDRLDTECKSAESNSCIAKTLLEELDKQEMALMVAEDYFDRVIDRGRGD